MVQSVVIDRDPWRKTGCIFEVITDTFHLPYFKHVTTVLCNQTAATLPALVSFQTDGRDSLALATLPDQTKG